MHGITSFFALWRGSISSLSGSGFAALGLLVSTTVCFAGLDLPSEAPSGEVPYGKIQAYALEVYNRLCVATPAQPANLPAPLRLYLTSSGGIVSTQQAIRVTSVMAPLASSSNQPVVLNAKEAIISRQDLPPVVELKALQAVAKENRSPVPSPSSVLFSGSAIPVTGSAGIELKRMAFETAWTTGMPCAVNFQANPTPLTGINAVYLDVLRPKNPDYDNGMIVVSNAASFFQTPRPNVLSVVLNAKESVASRQNLTSPLFAAKGLQERIKAPDSLTTNGTPIGLKSVSLGDRGVMARESILAGGVTALQGAMGSSLPAPVAVGMNQDRTNMAVFLASLGTSGLRSPIKQNVNDLTADLPVVLRVKIRTGTAMPAGFSGYTNLVIFNSASLPVTGSAGIALRSVPFPFAVTSEAPRVVDYRAASGLSDYVQSIKPTMISGAINKFYVESNSMAISTLKLVGSMDTDLHERMAGMLLIRLAFNSGTVVTGFPPFIVSGRFRSARESVNSVNAIQLAWASTVPGKSMTDVPVFTHLTRRENADAASAGPVSVGLNAFSAVFPVENLTAMETISLKSGINKTMANIAVPYIASLPISHNTNVNIKSLVFCRYDNGLSSSPISIHCRATNNRGSLPDCRIICSHVANYSKPNIDPIWFNMVIKSVDDGSIAKNDPYLMGYIVGYIFYTMNTPEAMNAFKLALKLTQGEDLHARINNLLAWSRQNCEAKYISTIHYYSIRYMYSRNDYYILPSFIEDYLSQFTENTDRVYWILALTSRKLQNNAKALFALQRLQEVNPQSPLIPDALYTTALIYYKDKNYDEVEKIIQEILKKYPTATCKDKAIKLSNKIKKR